MLLRELDADQTKSSEQTTPSCLLPPPSTRQSNPNWGYLVNLSAPAQLQSDRSTDRSGYSEQNTQFL